MTLHQHFRHGDRIELVPARKDKTTGECYTREKDVQRVFLDATLFKVKGAVLYYIEDENEEEKNDSLAHNLLCIRFILIHPLIPVLQI